MLLERLNHFLSVCCLPSSPRGFMRWYCEQQELLHQLPSDLIVHIASVWSFSGSLLKGLLHWPLKWTAWLCVEKGRGWVRSLTSLSCSFELLRCGRLSSCTGSSSLTLTARSAKGLICKGKQIKEVIYGYIMDIAYIHVLVCIHSTAMSSHVVSGYYLCPMTRNVDFICTIPQQNTKNTD